jgi:hypothetical protein
MKITETIISIPPYISTSWDNVLSLHMIENDLNFSLKDGSSVTVKHLSPDVVEQIFSAHAAFLEAHQGHIVPKATHEKMSPTRSQVEQLLNFPFHISPGSLENVGQALQHNPAYAGLPPIPDDVANKIATLAKVISEEDIMAMPPAEANCNCMYCQINRILRKTVIANKDTISSFTEDVVAEENISDAELHFEQWEIKTVRENMYTVTNKLDPKEQYTVYLGNPVGCTCGKANCEHIVAVLRS